MYQGHKNRACWNVALYLFNEEPLYRLTQAAVAESSTLDNAAENILHFLNEAGVYKTPDGYRYSKTAIRLALQHWEN